MNLDPIRPAIFANSIAARFGIDMPRVGTADPRGIPVGHGAAVPDPRPGRRIRAIVPLDRDGDGRGRGRYGATEPVAKFVCGTPDRQREARMPGPFDHPQRAAFAAHSWLIPRLLSRFKDPLVARQGHPGWTTRSAGRVRNGRFLAQGRRSASSLRTPRGLTTPARIRSIPLCGNVDAAGIRMPLHRFAGTIRRNKHRDDRAHGRLQNPLAQNDVSAGEPSRRWEARWNKWKGHPHPAHSTTARQHGLFPVPFICFPDIDCPSPVLQKRPPVLQKNRKVQKPLIKSDRPYLVKAGWAPNVLDMFSIEV